MQNISDKNLDWLDKVLGQGRSISATRLAGVWKFKVSRLDGGVSDGAHHVVDEALSSCRENDSRDEK